jgi:flagellar motor switch protein FliM
MGTPAGGPAAPETPLARTLARAVARTAQEVIGLPVRMTSVLDRRVALAELAALATRPGVLTALLDCGREDPGLLVAAGDVSRGLVEAMTTGRVVRPQAEPTPPTRADAAVVGSFLDRVCAMLTPEDDAGLAAVRVSAFLDGKRPVDLVLQDVAYRLVVVQLVLGAGGERHGEVAWAIPDGVLGPHTPEAGDAAGWGGALARAVLPAEAPIAARLWRGTLPLTEVMGLVPGSEVRLPAGCLRLVTLTDGEDRVVGHGRLGQVRGARAVRLTALGTPDTGAAEVAEGGGLSFEAARGNGGDGGAPHGMGMAPAGGPFPVPEEAPEGAARAMAMEPSAFALPD